MAQSFYAAPDAICRNVTGAPTAKIYKSTRVEDTVLGEYVTVGDFSRLGGCRLDEHVVTMGRYSYTGRNTTAWHADIGSFCSISWNVSIGGADHDYSRLTTHTFLYSDMFGLLPEGESGYDRFAAPCVIGHDVWIAANACICRGVTVGTGAVIGAGAVVTHDVEPYTVVAGAPARPIRRRFSDHIIARLLESRWWELPAQAIRENFHLFNAAPSDESLDELAALRQRYLGGESS